MTILPMLRKAIVKDGRPHSTIAGLAGIHVKTFSAFMHGRRGLSIESIENLAKALGMALQLTPVKQKKSVSMRRLPG